MYRQEILEIPCPIFHWQVCKEYIDILDNIFWESIFYLLVCSPPPHIPYISSPNQCLLFAAHNHTIATCFAVVSILYNLLLVFLSTAYLGHCLLSSNGRMCCLLWQVYVAWILRWQLFARRWRRRKTRTTFFLLWWRASTTWSCPSIPAATWWGRVSASLHARVNCRSTCHSLAPCRSELSCWSPRLIWGRDLVVCGTGESHGVNLLLHITVWPQSNAAVISMVIACRQSSRVLM